MAQPAFDTGFRIAARRVGHDVVVVDVAGDLDMQTVPQAEAFLIQATTGAPRHLVLDLTKLRFLASSGIGLLLAANDWAQEIHGRLHVVGVTGNNPVERPLALVGLLDRFDIAPDLPTLLDGLDPASPRAD